MATDTATNTPKIYLAGEADSPLPSVTGRPVDIVEIRSKHNRSNLYEDPDFPATAESIGAVGGDEAGAKAGAGEEYSWLRPHAIAAALGADRPHFAVVQDESESTKLFSEYDLAQGALGDCWYIAALQSLTENEERLRFVIPEDNITAFDDDHEQGGYCGAFHFRFFSLLDDKWVDVVVDDRLPVQPWNDSWRLAFAKASPKWSHVKVAEFWGPLIEKAYAKFIGSYAKIEAGYSSHAIENFTNGFSEIIDFTNTDTIYRLTSQRSLSLHDIMKRRIRNFIKKGTFMGIGSDDKMTVYKSGNLEGYSEYVDTVADDGTLRHSVYGYTYDAGTNSIVTDPSTTGLGLVCPHAYTIMDAREIRMKEAGADADSVFLLKLRNPHATHEWLGAYGENDDESWGRLEVDLRVRREDSGAISRVVDDGIFWMSLQDALKYFRDLEICAYGAGGAQAQYAHVRGEWPAFHQRVPISLDLTVSLQYCTAYKFEIRPDEQQLQASRPSFNVPQEFKGKCMVAITVVLGGYYSGINPLPLFNYVLYKVTEKDLGRPLQDVYGSADIADAGLFNVGREASRWTFLDPGIYIIVPYLVTEPDEQGNIPLPAEMIGRPVQYAIRLFTENETKLEPIPGVNYEE